MKSLFSLLLIFCTLFSFQNSAVAAKTHVNTISSTNKTKWAQNGHRVVGAIAQKYLTRRAKRRLKKIMGDTTLSACSNWMDNIKSDKAYNFMYSWHYINIDEGETLSTIKRNPKGDVLSAIDSLSKVLGNKNSTKYEKSFALKCLVHLVGDVHQPLHVGHKSDKGANDIKVTWFKKPTNLHHVWDEDMIAKKQLSYSELACYIDHPTKAQVAKWQKATPTDWVKESEVLAKKIYGSVGDGNLYYRYNYDYFPIVEERLLQAGVRLAALLNSVL